jgi:hypothetical protein
MMAGLLDPEDFAAKEKEHDPVEHPSHYNNHASGVECIDIVKHFNFCRGNAIKYIWRAGMKGGPEKEIEDLRKAVQNLQEEIERLEAP